MEIEIFNFSVYRQTNNNPKSLFRQIHKLIGRKFPPKTPFMPCKNNDCLYFSEQKMIYEMMFQRNFPAKFFGTAFNLYKFDDALIMAWGAKFQLTGKIFELMKNILVRKRDFSSFSFVLDGEPDVVLSIAENICSLKRFVLHRASTGLRKLCENKNFRMLVNYYFEGKKNPIGSAEWKKIKETVTDESFTWICNYFCSARNM